MRRWIELATLLRLGAVWLRQWCSQIWRAIDFLASLKPSYTGSRMHRVRRKVTKWGHTSGGNRHPFAKPDWERAAIFDLHATLPQAGCRSLANQFNAIHADLGFSVSKTWVSELLRQRRHALASSRRRSVAVSRSEPIQRVWGIDLTGLPIKTGESLPVWGVIEHGSRAVLQLEPVMRFNSLILLGKLLIAFGTFGLPRAIRSDNDAVFKTWAFRLMLKVLGEIGRAHV